MFNKDRARDTRRQPNIPSNPRPGAKGGSIDDWGKPSTTNWGAGGKLDLDKPNSKIAQAKVDQHVKDKARIKSNIAAVSPSTDGGSVEGMTGRGGYTQSVGNNPIRRQE